MIRLGFHLSIAGSIANAPEEALRKGYGAFQVFTTSSRSWKNSIISPESGAEFIRLAKSGNLEAYAHIPYLCNPSTTNEDVYSKSKEMLVNNMRNCNALGIKYLVIHLGSHLGSGVDNGIRNVCNALSYALDSVDKTNVLLENGSGYSNSVGSRFEEIGRIIDNIDSDRIGLCFDTCHAFAAGYDISNAEGVEETVNSIGDNIGLSKLRLVHLNDAKYPLGSGKDRHYHIGKGNIGRKGFASLFSNNAFSSGSFIMELPDDEEGTHNDDMHAVESIIRKAGLQLISRSAPSG